MLASRARHTAMRDAQKEMERAQRDLAREQRVQRVNVTRIRTTNENSSERFQAKETRTFTVSVSPRVTINTFDGHVMVHGWDKPEVAYTAIKGSHDEESLKNISIEAQQQGEVISII